MIYWLLSLLVSGSLFAQSVSNTSATPNGSVAHYHISPKHRAIDIINMFNTFNGSPYNLTKRYRIALQTTRNSLVNWVQSITPASNYTLLIVGYGSDVNPQYVVLPIEQITEVIYSIGTIFGGFNATATSGVLPIFEIDLLERANDIIQVVNTLLTNYRSYNGTPNVQVALQTSLTGSTGTAVATGTYAPVTNGLISDVQSVSLNSSAYGTLLLVTYLYGNNNSQTAYISVGTDQIYGINYYPTGP